MLIRRYGKIIYINYNNIINITFLLIFELLYSIRFGHYAKINFYSNVDAVYMTTYSTVKESFFFLGNLSDKLFSRKTNDLKTCVT